MTILDRVVHHLVAHYKPTSLMDPVTEACIFGHDPIEVRKIKIDEERQQPFSRYPDFIGIKESPFDTYNMNTVLNYPHIIVAEGPQNYFASLRLWDNTIHNPNIQQSFAFLALGAPQEKGRAKYYQYCYSYENKQFPNIGIGYHQHYSKHEVPEDQEPETITYQCLQVPGWQDMQGFRFTDQEIKFLFDWLNDETIYKVIHCSAGLGRSGGLVLAFAIAKHLGEFLLSEEEDNAIGLTIAEILIEMRQHRPGLVQTKEQLAMAIDLAQGFVLTMQKISTLEEDAVAFDLSKTLNPSGQTSPRLNLRCSTESDEEEYKLLTPSLRVST